MLIMKNNEFNIGGKTLIVCMLLIMGVVSTIFILNNYDSKRKKAQVANLYTQVESSSYLSDLEEIVNSLDTNSVAITGEIQEILQSVKLDIPEVDHCTLYIRKDGKFLEFNSYRNYKKAMKKKNIPIEDERIYTVLKSSDDKLVDLKAANEEIRFLKTCHILRDTNNEYSFLILKNYRN